MIIDARNLNKIYKKNFKKIHALKDVSFQVNYNQILGILGPNGAGKTTSIKILLGLMKPTSGSSFINTIPSQNPNARQRVAFVTEQPYFYRFLTVVELLEFVYKLYPHITKKLFSEINRVLHIVQLDSSRGKKVHTLSKGMQQRLNMALAMLGDPEIYIMDEPMSGLDPIGRKLFRDIFRELSQENRCIFFSTHILEDIETICNDIIAISNGSLVYTGPLKDLLSKYSTGKEIIVPKLPDETIAILNSMGYQTKDLNKSNNLIYTESEKKSFHCQELLYSKNIFPLSIKARTQSLEKILYNIYNREKKDENNFYHRG